MARMNKTRPITGRPNPKREDQHGAAVKAAHDNGLAAWAIANGYVAPDGSAMVHSAKQRRIVERAKAAAERGGTPE